MTFKKTSSGKNYGDWYSKKEDTSIGFIKTKNKGYQCSIYKWKEKPTTKKCSKTQYFKTKPKAVAFIKKYIKK